MMVQFGPDFSKYGWPDNRSSYDNTIRSRFLAIWLAFLIETSEHQNRDIHNAVVSTSGRNHEVTGSNPTPVRFESNVSALSELSINCTMAWVADRQVRAMLYATLAVS